VHPEELIVQQRVFLDAAMGICISSAEEVQVGDENIRAHEGGNGKQVAPAPMPEKTQTGGNDHMTLRHLLADEMARETFYNYLKREFAEENLSFFMVRYYSISQRYSIYS
jgi:hypothetical protein